MSDWRNWNHITAVISLEDGYVSCYKKSIKSKMKKYETKISKWQLSIERNSHNTVVISPENMI